MKPGARILIAGCGYVGSATAAQLRDCGHVVFGARRDARHVPDGVSPIAIDLLHGDLGGLPDRLDAIVWALAPQPGRDGYRTAYAEGTARLLTFLAERGDPIQRAVLVASTSVWHRGDGADVDETTPTNPADYRGSMVLAGEAAFAASPFRSVSLRFAGIYGPGRTGLIDRITSGEASPPTRVVYGNRIWRDDGAKAIVHALALPDPDPFYVVADDDPADLRDVYAFLAHRLGVLLPAPVDDFTARGGSKRCRNFRLRTSGWRPDVAGYRAGYEQLLKQR